MFHCKTNTSIIGIGESKLDFSILNRELWLMVTMLLEWTAQGAESKLYVTFGNPYNHKPSLCRNIAAFLCRHFCQKNLWSECYPTTFKVRIYRVSWSFLLKKYNIQEFYLKGALTLFVKWKENFEKTILTPKVKL